MLLEYNPQCKGVFSRSAAIGIYFFPHSSYLAQMHGFVVAGVSSGSGKTLVSLSLMAWFMRQGWEVQPFKVGPDFIDPGHHGVVTGRTSHNLDGWMLSRSTNRDIFLRYGQGADVCIVEGVMGLFDGFSATGESGSTAEMAKWLGLPVLLVAEAGSMARSAAALVKGYAEFDPDLTLAGVLFNRVGSPTHAEILRDAVHSATGLACLGFLPHDPELSLGSRHLGLVTAEETDWENSRLQRLIHWMDSGLCNGFLQALSPCGIRTGGEWRECSAGSPSFSTGERTGREAVTPGSVSIAVARDEAFCFYYGENLRLLQEAGARLCFFSPLRDSSLPEGVHGLYLGGGYPELYAATLSRNRSLLREVASLADSGKPVYAECGGFMYLLQSLCDAKGQEYPMAGVFSLQAAMGGRFRALGYREVRLLQQTPLGEAGTVLRGHEFHYSYLRNGAGEAGSAYQVRDRRGVQRDPQGFVQDNVLGSYIHLHFASNPESARFFVSCCGSG